MLQASSDLVTIQGPLWSAQAQLLDLGTRQDRALQVLFLEHIGATVQIPAYRSGTIIALCYIREVKIQPSKELGESYIWRRQPSTPPTGLNTNEWIREQLKTRNLSLLLLLPHYPSNSNSRPTQFTCLTGEIHLDTLQPEVDARNNLFARLQIQAVANTNQVQSEPDSPNSNTRTAKERLTREIAVHSSGLSIYGMVTLPWNTQVNQENAAQASGVTIIAAPFQLTQQFSRKGDEVNFSDFQLTLERERFTLTEEQEWIKLWQALIQQLNPRHPLYGRTQTKGTTAETACPHWVTLEFANPNRVPRLLWRISQWGESPVLNLSADELNIILSDSALYNPEKLPTSLARIVPSEVILHANENQQIVFEVNAKEVTAKSQAPQIIYRFNAETSVKETLSAANLKTAFSPVETPKFLRQTQNLSTPEWSSGNAAQPIQPAVVWGFMPLENGWAQLPVPNLTEQIYLDSELDINSTEQSKDGNPNPPVALIQGALSLGNDRPAVLKRYAKEQPWSLTITDTAALKGTWTLACKDSHLELTEISLFLDDPSVTLNGFFWLSTGQPRLQDALPSLDDWVSGLRSIPLETVAPSKDLFPSAIVLEWEKITLTVREDDEKLPSAALSPWEFSYTIDPTTLKLLIDKQILPAHIFRKELEKNGEELPSTLPLIWQRHPHLPMIQALPLTQNQLPANYPSASRQLVPYELDTISEQSPKPQKWRFAVTSTEGAECWSQCVGKLIPAQDWQQTSDLPLVSLSVPGLVLEPPTIASSNDSGSNLRLQYRFDLPYTDEVNALAQLPKDPVRRDQVSPLPNSTPPEPLQPLVRETFAQHWQQLSTLASLSMADAVNAFQTSLSSPLSPQASTQALIQNLIEPLQWPVQIKLDLTSYPGAIALQDGFNKTLTGASALEGISGDFYVGEQNHLTGASQPGQTAYQITAGSLAARLESGEMRDQRGLLRSATLVDTKFLHTRVRFERQSDRFETYDLTTTRQAQELKIADTTWKIWFRDLPLKVESGTRFNRANVHSSVAEDINDPQSRSRSYDFLTGYEWRLTEANSDFPYLSLLGLHFYPLTLDELEMSAGKINKIVMTGRLQLPLSEAKELEDFSNAVQITFQDHGIALKLDAIAAVGLGEWPLALEQNELTNAPLLTWQTIRLSSTKDQLIVEGLQLKFFLFEQEWIVAEAPKPQLVFSTSSRSINGVYTFSPQAKPISPKTLTVELDLIQGKHSVELELEIQLGKKQKPSSSQAPSALRTAFSATVNFPVLQGEITLESSAQWSSGHLMDDLVLKTNDSKQLDQNILHLNGQALQFQWSAYELKNPSEVLQLLPGLELQQESSSTATGFAALTFTAIAEPNSGIPPLQLQTAFVEALLFCRWGQSLQQDLSNPSLEKVFGSSAGDLVCGYTIEWQSQTWIETLLLNGVLEIKNLISWPQALVQQTKDNQTLLTLPVRQPNDASPQPLAHLRHTLRILLNQHRIPNDLLEVGEGSLLFQLKANAIWQFQAVVEHQLINISGWSPNTLTLEQDRRWTTVQEVRWLSPQRFKAILSDLQKATVLNLSLHNTALGATAGGYLNQELSTLLTEGNPAILDQLQKILLVESSAHHWINQTTIQAKSATTLQFLPNGSQLGILSSPEDYRPSDPNDPQWLLLTLPFLGRLQAQACDRLDLLPNGGTNTATSTRSNTLSAQPIQVDPILYLAAQLPNPSWALIFASWADQFPVELVVSTLDNTWSRLDPSSLEENWFRLQHPLAEPAAEGLQSVMAALPDNPSRLSRSLTLKQLTQGNCSSYPPSGSIERNDKDHSLIAQPNSLIWQPDHLLVTPKPRHSDAGLQVLYTFREDRDNIIRDVSEVGEPLNLHINDYKWKDCCKWEEGGLEILKPTKLESSKPATKLIEACKQTNALTIEAWVKPSREDQTNPARIITLSNSQLTRNFSLQQGVWLSASETRNWYSARLRSTGTDNNGKPKDNRHEFVAAIEFNPTPDLVHLVFTRDQFGIERLYINGLQQVVTNDNGAKQTERTVQGTFENWDGTFRFSLANEATGDRPWLGTYYKIAIYNCALTASKISHHYKQGHKAVPQRSLPYAWAAPGSQLVSSALAGFPQPQNDQKVLDNPPQAVSSNSVPDSTPSINRYVAATLLPSRLHPYKPISLAVSPYLSAEFQPVLNRRDYQLQLMSVELLCLHPVKQSLLPVASYFWEKREKKDNEQEGFQELRTFKSIMEWAKETYLRLCPDSAIAILRSREIRRSQSGTIPPLITTYGYAIVPNLQSTKTLARKVFRLRSKVAQLRFREGQYSGRELPNETLYPFELAPPQTIGVQPLHLTDRPRLSQNGSGSQDSLQWPWGLSALRVSLQYTEEQQNIKGPQGIVGQVQDKDKSELSLMTLWWQAPQHSVQYRIHSAIQASGENADTRATEVTAGSTIPIAQKLPAAGLPAQFRARAIQSFLPISLTPPMPTINLAGLLNWQGNAVERWQPVLPGQLRYLMVGNRPGVMHAIRNQLLRQSQSNSSHEAINTVLVSGSLPVQHRMPRPVPLPLNSDRQKALQPWASYFEPTQNLLVTDTPSAEAFYGATMEGEPAQRLQMCLIGPERGAISPQWDGTLKFSIKADSEPPHQPLTSADWEVTITLSDGEQSISYNPKELLASNPQADEFTLAVTNTVFQELLARQTSRSLLVVQAKVMPKSNASNFKQTLTFPLRLLDQTALPLPLKPQFIYFEDPEYNRRLASPAAHVSQAVPVLPATDNADPKLVEVKLSVDRREYNPDSVLSLRYDWAEPIDNKFKVQIRFRRITANGTATNLLIADPDLEKALENVKNGSLVQVQISLLMFKATDQTPALRPDDVLEVALIIFQNTEVKATLNLPLNIVVTPVNPAPEAAYALLRQHSKSRVECVRFAWGPTPSQVELVNADDLTTEVVRRRAIFQWTDSVRPNTAIKYAIQKITPTGSTYFPFV